METPSTDIEALLIKVARKKEITDVTWRIIEKCYQTNNASYLSLTQEEQDALLSPNETAAVLSVLHKRPISTRYIKELTRDIPSSKTGKVTPARLRPSRVIGGAFVYKASDVITVNIQKAKSNHKKQ